MTPRVLAAVVAAGDEARVLAAIAACAAELRGDDIGGDRRGLAELLVSLRAHGTADVRQEAAEISDAFPDPWFERAQEAFAADADRYVRAAARRARDRRAHARKLHDKSANVGRALGEALGEIERAHGRKWRRVAERAVRRAEEQVVATLDHELKKSDQAFARALAALEAEIDRPDRSPAALRDHAAALRSHFAFGRAIVRRVRESTTVVAPRFADHALAPLLAEARQRLLDHLGERATGVDVVLDVDATLRAHVDRDALLQVIQNALQNAVEAYEPGRAPSPVTVSARTAARDARVEIRVTDEGRGLSVEGQARLFVPFASAKPGGTGVGMLVMRTIVEEMHGGELSFESAEGAGARLTIALPARQPGVR